MKVVTTKLSTHSLMVWSYLKGNNIRSFSPGTRILLSILVILSVMLPREAVAQTATISGEVIDVSSGEALSGVGVDLQGVDLATTTNANGRFILHQAPSGDYHLEITHPGYLTRHIPISIDGDRSLEQPIELSLDADASGLVADTRLSAQPRALTRQYESVSFSSVISSEQLDRFADYSVQDALARFPGVQVDAHREVNLRGVGRNMHYATVDGQRMSTTGMGDRGIELGSLSLDMIQDVEVIKVLTPSMDADAVGGVVNLNTRRPVARERQISVRLGGGGHTRYLNHMGPASRASVSYAEAVTEDLFLSANMNHQLDLRGRESLQVGYNVAEFGNDGPDDVIEFISPEFQTHGQSRVGGDIQLRFQASEQTSLYFQGLMNLSDNERIRHSNLFHTQGDWLHADTTGLQGEQGTYDYNVQLQSFDIHQYNVRAGARHELARINLDYNLGWTMGQVELEQDSPHFQWSGMDYVINWENRNRPSMHIINAPLQRDGSVSPLRVRLQHHDRLRQRHVDNSFSGEVNFEIPFNLGTFQLGSSARFTFKDGFFNDARYSIFGPLNVGTYENTRTDGIDIFDEREYRIPQFVDPHGARAFYGGNRPRMSRDDNRHFQRSEVWNYGASEHIYAGYAMTTLGFGGLTLSIGARMEHTEAQYDGRKPSFDDQGRLNESPDTSDVASYSNIFPNAQLVYGLGDRTNIRAAFSRSIARPDFNRLAPFEQLNVQDTTLFRGNSGLEPMISDNLDLLFDHYYSGSGALTLGLFYKQLSGFVVERNRSRQIVRGEYPDFDVLFEDEDVLEVSVHERLFVNGDETAELYGFEASWQQNLNFLPGFLSNFGTFANYTWSHSVYDVDYRDDEVQLPMQRPHVVNAALDYSQGRFSTQVSYHWAAAAVNGLQETRSLAPAIDENEAIYMDRYQDGWKDLSVTFRLRISNNFRFWADASNILTNDRVQYARDRDLYPVRTDRNAGRSFMVGIRYDL